MNNNIKIISHVPYRIQVSKLTENQFIARCLDYGIGYDTAKKIARGDIGLQLKTAATASFILDAPLQLLFDVQNENGETMGRLEGYFDNPIPQP